MNPLNKKEQSESDINMTRERIFQLVISFYNTSIMTITFIATARIISLE